MVESPKDALKDELLRVVRSGRAGKAGIRPLELIEPDNSVLLCMIPDRLLPAEPDVDDRMRAATALLEHVSYVIQGKYGDQRAAFGDLLGLTNLSEGDIREFFDNYRGRGKPQEFVRYNRGVRLIISTRHFERGAEWAKGEEENWAKIFVAKLRITLVDPSELAMIVEKLGLRAPVSHAEQLPEVQPRTYIQHSTRYVVRSRYADAFAELISQGCKLIAFVGEPGNGKSRLADELVTQHMRAGDSRVYLNASSTSNLMTEIAGVLQARTGQKLQTYLTAEEELVRAFAAFVCSPDAPTHLVIDGVEDPALLKLLVPLDARPTVVVTSRINVLPDGRGQVLNVEPMSDDEAREFAGLLLPECDEQQINELVALLGNKPLAIDHACVGLLADGSLTIDEFHAAFERRAATVMKHAKTPVDQSLPFIYEQILLQLKRADAENGTKVATLLELIAFVAPDVILPELLSAALAFASGSEDASLARIEFQSGQRELQRRHLIQTRGPLFTIHQFTQAILRDLLREQAVERCRALHRSLYEEFRELVPEDGVSDKALCWLSNAVKILVGLAPAVDENGFVEGEIAHTLKVFVPAMKHNLSLNEVVLFALAFLGLPDPRLEIDGALGGLDKILDKDRTWRGDFGRLFLDQFYEAGLMTRSRYVVQVIDQIGRDHGSVLDVDLYSRDGVKLLEVLLIGYQHGRIEDLVAHRLDLPETTNRGEADTWQGCVWRVMAELYARRADWEKCFLSYRKSIEIFQYAPGSFDSYLGDLLTWTSMAEVSIDSNDLKGAAEYMTMVSDHTRETVYGRCIEPSRARFDARFGLTSFTLGLCLVKNKVLTAENRRDLDAVYERVFTYFKFRSSAHGMLYAKYHWVCWQVVCGEMAKALDAFESQLAEAKRIEDREIELLCELAIIKLRIFDGSVSIKDIYRSRRIAERFVGSYGLLVRSTDAFCVVYVAAVSCDVSPAVIGSFKEVVETSCRRIGKEWKFELIDRVGTEEFNPLVLFIP